MAAPEHTPQKFAAVNNAAFDVKAFDCNKPSMNEFLSRHAAKHMGKNYSSTWVLPTVHPKAKEKVPIKAYYTLCNGTVKRDEISKKAGLGSMPPFDLPVLKLARMAVSVDFQRQGIGEKSLIYAMRHAVNLNNIQGAVPNIALVLDVLDEDAKRFYDKFEFFTELDEDPMKLFVPMAVCSQI